MGEVYHAAYIRNEHGWSEVSPPGLYKPDAVPAVEGQGWVGIGTGWVVYAEQLSAHYCKQLDQVLLEAFKYDHPKAVSIAQIALPMFQAGLGRPAAEAAPVYIRNKVALKMSERQPATHP